jgi:putative GTP pyrophosphokinase
MINKEEFLNKFSIEEDEIEKVNLDWDVLEQIFEHYSNCMDSLLPTANYVLECLRVIPEVHSLKMRLKDPEHLLEKIIRKRIEENIIVSVEDYQSQITDLIGIRVLHLFKEDWNSIHEFVLAKWEQIENPVANIRKGDPPEFIDRFRKNGCAIKEHAHGYRSVHYLVASKPAKDIHLIEIQARTIFEEAWSEIDHRTRYPYDIDNPILSQFLVIFNGLAGSADEMGSFVRFLKSDLERKSIEASETIDKQAKIIDKLKTQIKDLKIDKPELTILEEGLGSLSDINIYSRENSPYWSSTLVESDYISKGVFITDPELSFGTGTYGSGSYIGKTWLDINDASPSLRSTHITFEDTQQKQEKKEKNAFKKFIDWIKSQFK